MRRGISAAAGITGCARSVEPCTACENGIKACVNNMYNIN